MFAAIVIAALSSIQPSARELTTDDHLSLPRNLNFQISFEETSPVWREGFLQLKEMQYAPYDNLQRQVYREVILERAFDATYFLVGYLILKDHQQKTQIFPLVGERSNKKLTLRHDAGVDFERVKKRDEFIPHSESLAQTLKVTGLDSIEEIELKGLLELTNSTSIKAVGEEPLVLSEAHYSGDVVLGEATEQAMIYQWKPVDYVNVAATAFYVFSPAAKKFAVASYSKDPKRIENFMRTISRLEKAFGAAKIQEVDFVGEAAESSEQAPKAREIIANQMGQNLSLAEFYALGASLYGSWKNVLSVGCGLTKTSQLPMVAKDTNVENPIFYGYNFSSSTGFYVRYREIKLSKFDAETSTASFDQSTWLRKSIAVEPFKMQKIKTE